MPSRGKKHSGSWRPKPFALAGAKQGAAFAHRGMGSAPALPPYVVPTAPGLEKVSDLLAAFVEPYLHLEEAEEDSIALLAVASTAWNIGLLPEEKQERAIQDTIRAALPTYRLPPSIDRTALLRDMVARRNRDFRRCRRGIVMFELIGGPERSTLRVSSTMDIPLKEADEWWANLPWVRRARAASPSGAKAGRSRP